MKAPESLETLIEYGIIQEVVRPLMSGKEAQVYVVVAGGEECVAKVYKEANQRTFKHRSDYTEGRRTRNTRDQRAMSKRSQHGRKKDEDAWRSTEVEMIYRLRDAGVRVPEPLNFVEGVLVMELVKNAEGDAAPRLGDLTYSPAEARGIYQELMREVIRMLCAGVIHGDLSEFNVLMSHDGPVVIDFPQAVDPTHNANSQKLLLRDVDNLHRFLARFAPDEPIRPYGEEIWKLYQSNKLEPTTELTGAYAAPRGKTDTKEVMALIDDASRDEQFRRHGKETDDEAFEAAKEALADKPAPFRKVVDFGKEAKPRPSSKRRQSSARRPGAAESRRTAPDDRVPPSGPASAGEGQEARTGRRRRSGGKSSPAPNRDATQKAQRGESPSGASAAKPTNPTKRRRPGRSRSRAQASGPDKPEAVKTETKRPANSGNTSDRARPSGEGAGGDRPPRRRRRRSRKVSSPE